MNLILFPDVRDADLGAGVPSQHWVDGGRLHIRTNTTLTRREARAEVTRILGRSASLASAQVDRSA